jgi:hypothetical protein
MIAKFLLILISLAAIARADYGDNILWRYSFGFGYDKYSNAPDNICRKKYQILFLHTHPYKIGGLNWNYAAATVGKGRWGAIGTIRSYNLDDIYSNTRLSIGGAAEAINQLFISLETIMEHEQFDYYGRYNKVSLLAEAQYLVKRASLSAGLQKISLSNQYGNSRKDPRPFINISVALDQRNRFSLGIIQAEKRRGCWFICHEVDIADYFSFHGGYLSYPNSAQCGLDFSWKKVKFSIIYQGIDKLDDTVIWGISTRK